MSSGCFLFFLYESKQKEGEVPEGLAEGVEGDWLGESRDGMRLEPAAATKETSEWQKKWMWSGPLAKSKTLWFHFLNEKPSWWFSLVPSANLKKTPIN